MHFHLSPYWASTFGTLWKPAPVRMSDPNQRKLSPYHRLPWNSLGEYGPITFFQPYNTPQGYCENRRNPIYCPWRKGGICKDPLLPIVSVPVLCWVRLSSLAVAHCAWQIVLWHSAAIWPHPLKKTMSKWFQFHFCFNSPRRTQNLCFICAIP